MITTLVAVNDGTSSDPWWSVYDQNGNFLFDKKLLDEIYSEALVYAADYEEICEIKVQIA